MRLEFYDDRAVTKIDAAIGPEGGDRLSGLRADYIKDRLEEENRSLRGRLIATGKGSREMMVGTGRDDASDTPELPRRRWWPSRRCDVGRWR